MKKTVLKVTIWIDSFISILIIVLAVHIYLVTQPKETNPTAAWQLARIDLDETTPLSQEIISASYKALKEIDGIQRISVNAEQGNIVIAYFTNKHTSENIYNEFAKKTNLNSSLFIPSKDQLAQGCPVIDEASISYKLGSFFQGIFHD